MNRGCHGSWIDNYLCNQCLSPLTLSVRAPLRRGELDTTLCDKVCQLLATGRWCTPGTPVSSTDKTDRHDITEILLKVVLSTITEYFPSLFSVKYEKIKFLVIALLDSIEIYAWAPKPYHKFMAFKVSSRNVPQFLSTSIWVCISSLLFFHVWPAILFLFTY